MKRRIKMEFPMRSWDGSSSTNFTQIVDRQPGALHTRSYFLPNQTANTKAPLSVEIALSETQRTPMPAHCWQTIE
jgi:hypothetical protein